MSGPDVVVLGAGVIGLTSAVLLAESGLAVECWAADPPAETTSRVAGALWAAPPLEDPDGTLARWAGVSLEVFGELAGDRCSGVRIAHGTVASRERTGAPLRMFPGVPLRGTDPPDGCVAAFELDAPLIEMEGYLQYLQRRLRSTGTALVKRRVRSLSEPAGHAPVIVNCSGLGARELVGDETLEPVRGQHVVVENPGLDDFFMEDRGAPEWACWFPHGERVVLGGVAQPGAVDLAPLQEVSRAIIERCAAIEPRLDRARVVGELVGLRPVRPSVRVEAEDLHGARCLHNYGHGRSGVSLSWGCAEEVLRLLHR